MWEMLVYVSRTNRASGTYIEMARVVGSSQAGKAGDFESPMHWFESSLPIQDCELRVWLSGRARPCQG
jgi:hypothetical protein